MKCISIKQPWAWLIAAGHKDIENRTWATKFRGECFIHASKGMTRDEYELCKSFSHTICSTKIPAFKELKRGGIIGKCEIFATVTHSDSPWFCDQVGWRIRNAMHFSQLHPMKGRLGFFDVEKKLIYHTEDIICPMCEELQTATVEHTVPWYSFIHDCSKCGYIIMESEWEAAPTETTEGIKA